MWSLLFTKTLKNDPTLAGKSVGLLGGIFHNFVKVSWGEGVVGVAGRPVNKLQAGGAGYYDGRAGVAL